MRGLVDKVVVVAAGGTEATAGEAGARASIGGVTARRLAAEGASVVVGDLDLAAAERTVRLIDDDGGKAVAQRFDAVDGEQINALIERAVQEFGGIDGLHYNAADQSPAILGKDLTGDALSLPLDVWHKTIDVALTGYLLACRATIPRLLERGGGAIVGTMSTAAYVGRPDTLAYSVAKLGMTPVTRHIASRWGREGVRANTIAPGMVPGKEMTANMTGEERSRLMGLHRSPRLGQPDDIAAMVAFLLSEDGAWINGQSIAVDGGLTMRP
jgi:NAD(P)-dependent dehydrogenase (short-subunit alcohol dehydrogenase family)